MRSHFTAILGARDYRAENQIGAAPDLYQYIEGLVAVFRELRGALQPDGTFWLNIGNTYSSGGRKRYGQEIPNPRKCVGIELNDEYPHIAEKRTGTVQTSLIPRE